MFIIELPCLGSLAILHATILTVLIFAGHKGCNKIPTPYQHVYTHIQTSVMAQKCYFF